ncbi:Ribosomal RNA large subunit methyltransferase E [Melia azedarach]|uniref:Ribosomal RNA large subunit methyltransferase E n=1 Tax=Melia azedarach TaxID=155640 RepID=A0ACC1Y813_MELAZ|nr:Ribosomal RNA large subunit methyltransferase E [Melia azedarach]
MSGAGTPDFFYREAQRLGYVARSAFKLLQIQKQYKLIKPGSSILDLGCAPGAWLQVACQCLGPLNNGGAVVGIDIKKVKVPSLHCDARVQTVSANVMNLCKHQVRALSPKGHRHQVNSDSSPDDSGVLQHGGHLVIKLLESEDVQEFSQICKPLFRKASWLRPKATRSSSREIYLICQGLKSVGRIRF